MMMTTEPTDVRSATTGGLRVRTDGLGMRFGSTAALDGVSVELGAGRIHGLLGRNGAGKTTLLSILASLRRPTAGAVELDGAAPFENERLMGQVCLIREGGDVVADERLSWNLDFQEMARPSFDRGWADHLVHRFGLDPKAKPKALSRGQRSMFAAAIGLASRAPLTMFDEVHGGMDAPTRELFYETLLADFAERPRTVVISSHLINEVEHLLETVTILHHGRVLLSDEADAVRLRGLTLTGPAPLVGAASEGIDVIARRDLGSTRQVTAFGDIDPAVLAAAEADGVTVGTPSLQDLFVHLTGHEET